MEPGTAAALLAFLESMRFMLRVEPEDVTAAVRRAHADGTSHGGG